jgi:hypothetical protein
LPDAGLRRPATESNLDLGAGPELLGRLAGFRVGVTGIDLNAERAGLTATALRGQIEAGLRGAGVTIVRTGREALGPGDVGSLILSVFMSDEDVPHGAVLLSAYQDQRRPNGTHAQVAVWEYVETLSAARPRSSALGAPTASDVGPNPAALQEQLEKSIAMFAGRYLDARRDWLQVVHASHDHFLHGAALKGNNRCDEALRELAQVEYDTPDSAESILRIAECLQRTNRVGQAIAYWALVTVMYPETEAGRRAAAELQAAYQGERAPSDGSPEPVGR